MCKESNEEAAAEVQVRDSSAWDQDSNSGKGMFGFEMYFKDLMDGNWRVHWWKLVMKE